MDLNVYSTFNKINLWCNLTGILAGVNLASYEQLSVCTCVCVYVFLCVYLNVALPLRLGEGGIHLRHPKLNNQKNQVKGLLECCDRCFLSGCIIHRQ